MSKRRKPTTGRAPMSGYACDVAVSEMTGISQDDMCGWVLVAVRHEGGKHQAVIVPCDREYVDLGHAAVALRAALANLEAMS